MNNEHHYTSGETGIWIQPDGPGTAMTFLGCHSIDSITVPLGDFTPFYCPDPSGPNRQIPVGETSSPPGALTTSIMEDVTGALSLLRETRCPFGLYIDLKKCARKDIFPGGEVTWIIDARKITQRTINNVAGKEDSQRMERSYDISAFPPEIEVRKIAVQTQATTETEPLNFVHFDNTENCAGACGTAQAVCQNGIAGADAQVAVAANVLYTTDKGITWTAAVAAPFAVAEDILTGTTFDINSTTRRWLVGRGTTDAGNAAEVAYSDDSGATWTNADVGSTNAEYFPGSNSLFALNYYYIWGGLDSGDIYFSDNGGVSWTLQNTGTTEEINAIHFANKDDGYAAGTNGVVIKTTDGGLTWEAVTVITGTPELFAVLTIDEDNVYVGGDDGSIWKSFDGGTTWVELFSAGTSINDIKAANKYVIYAIDDDAILRTKNGGEDWEVEVTPANTDLQGLHVCNSNTVYAVGESSGNAAFIARGNG